MKQAAFRPKTVRVRYPLERGRMMLRTDAAWETDVEPSAVRSRGTCFEFRLELTRPYLYFKPVIVGDGANRWSVGRNYLLVAAGPRVLEIYPHFREDSSCSACELRELGPDGDGVKHAYRVFYPPGYAENGLKRYPVVYMQDGQNLFFPHEAFGGSHWRIPETLTLLDAMNAIDKLIVVGSYPNQRAREYTRPGYEAFGRYVVDTLKPAVDAEFRTLTGPVHTATMGASLGAVVSFYLHWQWPDVFGKAACMSGSFGWRDDLRERVRDEPRRAGMIYLDSGWPGDNYEANRDLRNLLVERGYGEGKDLLYLAFPEAVHSERSWALRAHIPLQFFFDRMATGRRRRVPK